MKLVDLSRSLLILPTNYQEVRPHHVALGVALLKVIANSTLVQRLSEKVLGWLSQFSERCIPLIHMGLVPDGIIRFGIRIQLYDHLNILKSKDNVELELQRKLKIVQTLKTMPIAIATDEANEQHYEVPAKFYDLCLGPRKKYSSGLWPTPQTTFGQSEVNMLEHYCELANVQDGMHIVDLGCGWGSLTLHLAERYPNAKITGISNSHSQREYILSTAKARGYKVENITIVTCNVSDDKGALNVVKNNDLVMTVEMCVKKKTTAQLWLGVHGRWFVRGRRDHIVVSAHNFCYFIHAHIYPVYSQSLLLLSFFFFFNRRFEHMKNYDHLMKKVHGFLKPGGRLFVHIFTHKDFTYHFEEGWMSENFFTGGTMPSDDLLLYFANDFAVQNHWRVNGTNYEKTSNGWLDMLDRAWKSGELQPVLAEAYGEGKEREWYVNWRLFFLACAELWGLENGNEWIVSLYLFEKR